jgi:hypothetical protein
MNIVLYTRWMTMGLQLFSVVIIIVNDFATNALIHTNASAPYWRVIDMKKVRLQWKRTLLTNRI